MGYYIQHNEATRIAAQRYKYSLVFFLSSTLPDCPSVNADTRRVTLYKRQEMQCKNRSRHYYDVVGCRESEETAHFFSTLTFWLSQLRPSKMPSTHVNTSCQSRLEVEKVGHTFTARRAARLDFPNVVFGYSVQVQGACYVVWSHCCIELSVPLLLHALPEKCHSPPSTSCLLAKTSRTTLRISRSWMMRPSSDFASSMRALSEESMTKIRAWVPVVSLSASVTRAARLFSVGNCKVFTQRSLFLPHSVSDIHTREIMSPQRPDLVLSAYIPHIEPRVLVCHCLNVEADCRDGVDFTCCAWGELEGVEDGCATC